MSTIKGAVTSQAPKDTAVFIDGFNVYHFIAKNNRNLLWLDYMRLSQLLAPIDRIVAVDYFSAEAFWDHGKVLRHRNYIRALEYSGVSVHLGKFADKDKMGLIRETSGPIRVNFQRETFQARKQKFYTHEEKQTDVAIGVKMYRAACQGKVQKIILISNDTDFVPALTEIAQDFPSIRLKVYAPVSENWNLPSAVRKIISKKHHKHLSLNQLEMSQLPDPIRLPDGTSLNKPSTW